MGAAVNSPLPTRPCGLCHRPVAWVLTDGGARMPVDPKPDEAGNVYVRAVQGRYRAKVSSKAEPRPPGVPFMPHWATCPEHNKGAKPRQPKPEPAPSLFDHTQEEP